MCMGMGAAVPPTPYVSADKAYPETCGRITVGTRREGRRGWVSEGNWGGASTAGGRRVRCTQVLRVATYRTPNGVG